MGTIGTRNAEVLWRIVHEAGRPMTEAEVRKTSDLGVGTVNRLLSTMAAHGHLTKHRSSMVRYTANGTVEDVRRRFSPKPCAIDQRPCKLYGQDIGRVSSVWALAEGLA